MESRDKEMVDMATERSCNWMHVLHSSYSWRTLLPSNIINSCERSKIVWRLMAIQLRWALYDILCSLYCARSPWRRWWMEPMPRRSITGADWHLPSPPIYDHPPFLHPFSTWSIMGAISYSYLWWPSVSPSLPGCQQCHREQNLWLWFIHNQQHPPWIWSQPLRLAFHATPPTTMGAAQHQRDDCGAIKLWP